MTTARKLTAGVLTIALIMAWAGGSSWAAKAGGGRAGGTKADRVKPGGAKADKAAAKPAAVAARIDATIEVLKAAIDRLTLDTDARINADAALVKWKEAQTAQADRRKMLQGQLKAEADQARKDDLRKQLAELKEPTDAANYASIKAALTDALPADRSARLDEQVKAAQGERATRTFQEFIDRLPLHAVTLTDDQKTRVDVEAARLGDELKKLAAGELVAADSLARSAISAVRNNVLTVEQQTRLAPPPAVKGKGKAAGAGVKRAGGKRGGTGA